jgi:uncharacterized protein (DUF1800 family)
MNRRQFLNLQTQDKKKEKIVEIEPDLTQSINPYSNKKLPDGLEILSYSILPYNGNWDTKHVAHLLRRTTFGFSPSDFRNFKNKSLNDAVSAIIDFVDYTPSPPLNNYSSPSVIDPNIPLGQTWVNDSFTPPNLTAPRFLSFKSWATGQLINQECNIREKMTQFWHNHFAVEAEVVQDGRFLYKYNQFLRGQCLGNFKNMVKTISKDPSMLYYLNGYKNTKNAPDENYARELMELFTLGKGADSNYTEDDVKQAARVLTGWRINISTVESNFQPTLHDTQNKTFSGFFNNQTIVGRIGADGALEKDELIDMIFMHADVISKHLCRKLYRYFCYYNITEQTETNVIEPLAQFLVQSNWEIKPVIQKLLLSEHFYDINSKGCYIKNPFDFVVGFTKAFQTKFTTDLAKNYSSLLLVNSFTTSQGLNYFDPPSVAGWPAYHQSPQYHQIWINSDTLTKRKQLIEILLSSNGIATPTIDIKTDIVEFVSILENPSNPVELINESLEILYAIDISSTKKTELKSILLSGQSQDFYWTDLWQTYQQNKTTENKQMVYIRLYSLFQHLLSLPEYQLA